MVILVEWIVKEK